MPTPFPRGMGIREAGPAPQISPQGNIYGDLADVARGGAEIAGDVQAHQEGEANRKKMIDDMVYKRQIAQQAREADARFKQADMDFKLAKEEEDTRQFEVGEARKVKEDEANVLKTEQFAKQKEEVNTSWGGFKDDVKELMGPAQPGIKRRLPAMDELVEQASLNGVFESKEGRDRFKNFAKTQGMTDYQVEGLLDKRESAKRAKEASDVRSGTTFTKNTGELKGELQLFKKLDNALPGGLYGKDDITGFGFGLGDNFRKFWKSEQMQKIRPTMQALFNQILKRRSGAAVSDQEFSRLQDEFGINTFSTVGEFRKGLQNYYEGSKMNYSNFAAADPESAARFYTPPSLEGEPSFGVQGNTEPALDIKEKMKAIQPNDLISNIMNRRGNAGK